MLGDALVWYPPTPLPVKVMVARAGTVASVAYVTVVASQSDALSSSIVCVRVPVHPIGVVPTTLIVMRTDEAQ